MQKRGQHETHQKGLNVLASASSPLRSVPRLRCLRTSEGDQFKYLLTYLVSEFRTSSISARSVFGAELLADFEVETNMDSSDTANCTTSTT